MKRKKTEPVDLKDADIPIADGAESSSSLSGGWLSTTTICFFTFLDLHFLFFRMSRTLNFHWRNLKPVFNCITTITFVVGIAVIRIRIPFVICFFCYLFF